MDRNFHLDFLKDRSGRYFSKSVKEKVNSNSGFSKKSSSNLKLNKKRLKTNMLDQKHDSDTIVISSSSEEDPLLESSSLKKDVKDTTAMRILPRMKQNLKRKTNNSHIIDDCVKGKKQRIQSNSKDIFFTNSEIKSLFENDQFSKEIRRYCTENQQQTWFLEQKQSLARALARTLNKGLGLKCQIFIVGSSVNGFGRHNSDCDLCLVVDKHTTTLAKFKVMNILNDVRRLLRHASFVKNLQLIPAKVRIIKFRDSTSGMECDLNVNNLTGIRNTQLLHAYAFQDPRLQPLVLCVKEWAHQKDINQAKLGTLSSYCLALMVLHYLQVAVSPPVLPNLQRLYPDRFSVHTPIDRTESLACSVPVCKSQNKQSLSDLLIGFFRYFASYNFKKVMSIRNCNCFYPDDSLPSSPWHKKSMRIEEPFDLSNVARAVQNDKFTKIRYCLIKASKQLKQGSHLEDLIKVSHRHRSSFGSYGVSDRFFS